MKKINLIFLLGLSLSFQLHAQLSIDDAFNLHEQMLRDFLARFAAQNHHPISYDEAKWYIYNDVFVEQAENGSNYVRDVYCGEIKSKDHSLASKRVSINVEHSWPRSKFNDDFDNEIQKADLFHLYPTDREANNQRANHPFGEVRGTDAVQGECPSSQIGLVNSRDYPVAGTQTFFEPPEDIRGDIARSLFYFAIRYNLRIAYTQEYFLRKWNHDDPVSPFELLKAARITAIQGNQNPFILFPDLVDEISDF